MKYKGHRKNVGKGLGKGLEALIPERPAGPENQIQSIPVGQIKPGVFQARTTFDERKLGELADSIRENGIVQPIIVRPVPSGYELVAGERRWRAAKHAGLTHMPAVVRKLDDRKTLELSLIENVQRTDLNPVESARGYQALIDEFGLTQEEVSKVTGKNRATIANMVRLLKLPVPVRKMLEDEKISTGHAKVLLGFDNESHMMLFAEKTLRGKWSVRELELRMAAFLNSVEKLGAFPCPDPDLDAFCDVLRKKFATKIHLVPQKTGGGKIVMEYYNSDDLNRLLELLGGN